MGGFNDNTLFIHIPKTGGVTAKRYLEEHLPGFKSSKAAGFPIGHIRLCDVGKTTGRRLGSFQHIIAILRDPYEQQLSSWQFHSHRYLGGCRNLISRVAIEHTSIEAWLQDKDGQFEQWYANSAYADIWYHEIYDTPQWQGLYHWWMDLEGQAFNGEFHLLNHANLATELRDTVKEITGTGVKELPLPGIYNKGRYTGGVEEHYTPKAYKAVEDKFQWAFTHFFKKHQHQHKHKQSQDSQ